jgi:hypothetical protein
MNKLETFTDSVLTLAAALLAPLFLPATNGDREAATSAAARTLREQAPSTATETLLAAQATGFALAALHSLGASVAPGLPAPLALRLRTAAATAHRSAATCRKALDRARETNPQPNPDPIESLPHAAEANARKPPADLPPPGATQPPPQDALNRTLWAAAMTSVAQEYANGIARMPPAQRQQASLRARSLGTTATALLAGLPPFA